MEITSEEEAAPAWALDLMNWSHHEEVCVRVWWEVGGPQYLWSGLLAICLGVMLVIQSDSRNLFVGPGLYGDGSQISDPSVWQQQAASQSIFRICVFNIYDVDLRVRGWEGH